MNTILSNLKIQVNEKIYVKDPETSTLGKKIIQESIILIDEIGFELFTFKKLGERIGSNESSIYRYFESKHKLLVYLSSWYWGWMEYRLVFSTSNIVDPMDRLKRAITIVTEKIEGFFLVYKRVINRIIDIIQEINPEYGYAKSLASSIVEGSLHQHFLKDHLKTITNCNENNSPTDFYIDLAQKTLRK